MTAPTLFDLRTLDPGVRARFAEDRYAPMRIRVARAIPVDRGPAVGLDELTALVASILSAAGVDVHAYASEIPPEDEWAGRFLPPFHYAIIECSILAESHGHAAETFARLVDDALDELEDEWRWFETRPASEYRPRGARR